MNDLIKERDERTKRRKKFKKRIDKEYNLSYKDDDKMLLSSNGTMTLASKKVRLLDEGAVVGDEYVSFIIRKGTLEKYLEGKNKYLPNLDDEFVGTVNLGHMDFATFPFIIGEWSKKDLSLVDIGDERVGIDVKVKLDKKSVFVQELKRQPYDIGISSEFYYHVDEQASMDIGIPVIDEVMIFAYGLVGECGNVNSSGLELKGDFDMNEEIKIAEERTEELSEAIDEIFDTEEMVAETETEEAVELDAEEEQEEVEELSAEETSGETEATEPMEMAETVAEEEQTEELSSEEAEHEEVEELSLDDEVESDETRMTKVEKLFNELQAENIRLKEENKALKESNNRLQKKLKSEKEKADSFFAKFTGMLAVATDVEKPKETERNIAGYIHGDGIGE